jgi:Holliday junction resolvase RusA-like endonuclease
VTPITITLPWPDAGLSPNARVHWSVKHRKTTAAKWGAYTLTRKEMRANEVLINQDPEKRAKFSVSFQPPTGARRDVDNLIASIKAACDGIALAIGIDDSRWQWSAPVVTAPRRPGCVVVTIEPVEASHEGNQRNG